MALSLIFCDSFDHYSALADKWTVDGVDDQIDGVGSRTGTGNLLIKSGAFGPKLSGVTGTKFLTLTAFLPSTAGQAPPGNILQFVTNNGNAVRLVYDATLAVSVNDVGGGHTFGTSAPNVLVNNGYNHIAFRLFFDSVAGSCRVRVNGQIVLDLNNINTQFFGDFIVAFQLLSAGGIPLARHDDVALFSWTNPATDDIASTPRIYAALPVSDNAPLQWTPDVGVVHFSRVNEIPPDGNASYCFDGTVGHVDQYIHAISLAENVPPIGVNPIILGAQHNLFAEEDAAGVRAIQSDVGGVASGIDFTLTTSYRYYKTPYNSNPATGLPWVVADLAAVPLGPKTSI